MRARQPFPKITRMDPCGTDTPCVECAPHRRCDSFRRLIPGLPTCLSPAPGPERNLPPRHPRGPSGTPPPALPSTVLVSLEGHRVPTQIGACRQSPTCHHHLVHRPDSSL